MIGEPQDLQALFLDFWRLDIEATPPSQHHNITPSQFTNRKA
jgi:hypothetical protein